MMRALEILAVISGSLVLLFCSALAIDIYKMYQGPQAPKYTIRYYQ